MSEVPFAEAKDGVMDFTDETWENDSIKVHNCQIHVTELLNKAGQPVVTVNSYSPVIAFWSPYGKQAPFVCIEPWYGIGDPRGFNGEFKDKPMMNHLLPGSAFSAEYSITISV